MASFFCLAVGALFTKKLQHWSDRMLKYFMYLLLLGLGIKIGADRNLLASLPGLGLQSLVVCLLASASSVVLPVFWGFFFLKDNNLQESGRNRDDDSRALWHEYVFILNVAIFLLAGVAAGYYCELPSKAVSAAINLAMIFIYVSVGVDLKSGLVRLKKSPHKAAYLFLPLLILFGSAAGGLLAGLIMKIDIKQMAAIGAGAGYYSLTSAIITQKSGIEMGFVAFLTNFLREVLTFFLAPLLARLSSLAPIAFGGATTMDTTLAVIKSCLGKEYAVLGFISGAILTFVIPLLLVIILSF